MKDDFSIERVDHGREYELIYREPGRELRLWLELTGFFAEYDRVCARDDVSAWSSPSGIPIDAPHAAAIQARVEKWGHDQGTRIGFVPTTSDADHWEAIERDWGYRPERQPDGSFLMRPPSLWGRLGRVWSRVWSRP